MKKPVVFEKHDFVESCTMPMQIRGYVVDYAYVDGFQCVAIADDKLMNDGDWYFASHLRKGYERKQVYQ